MIISRQRVATSFRSQIKEYRARLFPLFMVALLPVFFWAGTYFSLPSDSDPIPADTVNQLIPIIGAGTPDEISERDTWPMDTTLMGVAWGIGAAAMFSVIGSVTRDRRLMLTGFRPWEIIGTRLSILLLIAVPVSLIPVVVISVFADSPPANTLLVWVGSYFTAMVGASAGLIIGTLLPRQLEGTILLIGIVGIELSLPLYLDVSQFLPLHGPQALFTAGRFASEPIIEEHVIRSIAWLIVLSAIAVGLWSWRVKVHRWGALQHAGVIPVAGGTQEVVTQRHTQRG